jgi:RecA-family ATPase
MLYNMFPCGADKRPLIKDWQALATRDPKQIELWSQLFRERLTHWGVPTGRVNNLYVLDVDVKGANGFETLKTLALPLTMTQNTPSGGRHYFFKYPNDGKEYGNKVKFLPGLDTRGNGGYVVFYGSDQTPVADAPDWLTNATVKPTYDHVGPTIKVDPSIAEGIIKSSIERIREAPEGERNNTLNTEAFRIGQLVSSGSITREYAERMLLDATKDILKVQEARATIESGLKGGNSKPMTSPFGEPAPTLAIPPPPSITKWTPMALNPADLFNAQHLKRPQLFEDWSTEDIHITTADGGTGKTTLKLFEAVCLAIGERFLGFNCLQPGRTLYITGEDSEKKLTAMIGMILKQMGISDDRDKVNTVLNNIFIKKDDDLCLITKDRQGFLQANHAAMNKILEAVYDIKPKMIVIDPIASFWGSEAAVNDMGKAVSKFVSQLVHESQACVDMINHMGKVSSSNKDMTQFAGRGGTGLVSHARVSRVIRPVFSDEYQEITLKSLEEGQSAMMLNVNKFSDGSPLYNKPFLLVREGYLFTRQTFEITKVDEERAMNDCDIVYQYVHECRLSNKFPAPKTVIAHFSSGPSKMSKERAGNALRTLEFDGYNGKFVVPIVNPDATARDQYVLDVSDKPKGLG